MDVNINSNSSKGLTSRNAQQIELHNQNSHFVALNRRLLRLWKWKVRIRKEKQIKQRCQIECQTTRAIGQINMKKIEAQHTSCIPIACLGMKFSTHDLSRKKSNCWFPKLLMWSHCLSFQWLKNFYFVCWRFHSSHIYLSQFELVLGPLLCATWMLSKKGIFHAPNSGNLFRRPWIGIQ